MSNQFGLLRQRRFLPFFLTQALGAFNDNVFKNALVVLITSLMLFGTAQKNAYANLAAGLFILPYFLFSATSGQLADKYDKTLLARWVKLLEVAIMIVAAFGFVFQQLPLLLAMLFMMGLHSTLFGPLKYGILPQVLHDHELVGGNGLIEMATFVAILLGSILGSLLIGTDGGPWLVGGITIALAVGGWLAARAMPPVAAVAPDLRLNWNIATETASNLRYVTGNRTVFLACLGISWFWFYGSVYFIQLPNYNQQVLGGTDAVYTLLLSVFSIGIGLGSLFCEKLSGHKVEIGLVPFGSIGMTVFGVDLYFARPDLASGGAALAPLQFLDAPGSLRILIDLAGMAIFSGFFIVPLFALIQTRTEPTRLARVIAANNILNAAFMVAASVLAVVLLNNVGLTIPELLLYTALLNAAVAIYIYTLVPEFLLRFLTWIVINTMYRLRVEGLDRIPEHGPALLVCNHVSFMDALIIGGTVRRPIRFVMHWKIFQWPGLSWLFKTARAIPIAGKKENPEMMERAFAEVDRELAEGHLVAIFPEGGITRDGTIQPFRPGVERILAARPVPVVPLALRGMWGSLFSRRDRLRIPRRFWSRIGVAIGEPVLAEEASAALLEQRVRALRGEAA
jgi:1-acyl-sn-glycerol-3-phosphate acyltransferase